jgi:GTP-binding protein
MGAGPAVAYAIDALQDRGRFFVEPGDELYMGQIVGENTRDDNIVVNLQKGKKLTNMRSAGADKNVKLAPAVKMSLEESLEHINHDELVEVTPKSIRLRKLQLDENDRKRAEKQRASQMVGEGN